MFNIPNHQDLVAKLKKAIDEDINDDTELKVSHDDWKVIVSALEENYFLKLGIEHIYSQAAEPIVNPLEVGFRHTPYSDQEIRDRLKETCRFIASDAKAILEGCEKQS